jgi:hypothetical protein
MFTYIIFKSMTLKLSNSPVGMHLPSSERNFPRTPSARLDTEIFLGLLTRLVSLSRHLTVFLGMRISVETSGLSYVTALSAIYTFMFTILHK